MRQDYPYWRRDFPLYEEFEDFSGKTRTFVIDCQGGPLGFTVRAREKNPKDEGYLFAVYSETSPYNALGRLRDKARKAMATRHLDRDHGMLHDTLTGYITSDGDGGTLLVVDGHAVSIDRLSRILATHEGWDFELKILSSLE